MDEQNLFYCTTNSLPVYNSVDPPAKMILTKNSRLLTHVNTTFAHNHLASVFSREQATLLDMKDHIFHPQFCIVYKVAFNDQA